MIDDQLRNVRRIKKNMWKMGKQQDKAQELRTTLINEIWGLTLGPKPMLTIKLEGYTREWLEEQPTEELIELYEDLERRMTKYYGEQKKRRK